jgi:hypothetical protein
MVKVLCIVDPGIPFCNRLGTINQGEQRSIG